MCVVYIKCIYNPASLAWSSSGSVSVKALRADAVLCTDWRTQAHGRRITTLDAADSEAEFGSQSTYISDQHRQRLTTQVWYASMACSPCCWRSKQHVVYIDTDRLKINKIKSLIMLWRQPNRILFYLFFPQYGMQRWPAFPAVQAVTSMPYVCGTLALIWQWCGVVTLPRRRRRTCQQGWGQTGYFSESKQVN